MVSWLEEGEVPGYFIDEFGFCGPDSKSGDRSRGDLGVSGVDDEGGRDACHFCGEFEFVESTFARSFEGDFFLAFSEPFFFVGEGGFFVGADGGMGCLGTHFSAAEFEVASEDEALFIFEFFFSAFHWCGYYLG